MGFLPESKLLGSGLRSGVARCGICGLYKTCKSPKMPVSGRGKRGVLVVAEAPGSEEDDKGVQLIGKSGQLLRSELKRLGWDLDRDCWKTNAVICRPPDNKLDPKCVGYCQPNLNRTIEELKPHTILLLGMVSVQSLIGQTWTRDLGSLERWVGWTIPSEYFNAWVCPTYHPAYLLRKDDPVLLLWFRKHLEGALGFDNVPWSDGVTDWGTRIRSELSPNRAAELISSMSANSDPISFDYETDRLKPDSAGSSIVSCAVCWGGKRTLAYPWSGPAIEATSNLLRSSVPKYGANIKFEQRWTKVVLGHGVRNWKFDTMQAAHVLDNRHGITSVKFQAFVRLGVSLWDKDVSPFLEVDGGNQPNRIREVDLRQLLVYNGMDALLEYKLAEIMMKELE